MFRTKRAMQEIMVIMKKHDLCGYVILAEEDSVEVFHDLVSSSWSVLEEKIAPQGMSGFGMQIEKGEQGRKKAIASIKMICGMADILAKAGLFLQHMATQYTKALGVKGVDIKAGQSRRKK